MKSRFLIIPLIALVSACGGDPETTESATTPAAKAVPVHVEELQPQTFKDFVTVQGAVESDKTILISAKTSATVSSINVSAGDRVKEGDILARLDGQIVENQIEEVKTGLALARDLFNRQKNLRDQNIGSEVDYLQAKNRVESLEKQLATLNEQYSYYTIRATIPGTVDRVSLKVGETVNPGVPVFQIANSEALKVVAEISEAYISTVDKTDSVTITFPSTDISYKHTLDVVSRVINASNRTFTVEIYIPDFDGKVLPNMVAKLKINDVTENDRFVVSPNMVHQANNKLLVYVAEQKGTDWVAGSRFVQTGRSYGNSIVISDGLKQGDVVITKGYNEVTIGKPVSIISK